MSRKYIDQDHRDPAVCIVERWKRFYEMIDTMLVRNDLNFAEIKKDVVEMGAENTRLLGQVVELEAEVHRLRNVMGLPRKSMADILKPKAVEEEPTDEP